MHFPIQLVFFCAAHIWHCAKGGREGRELKYNGLNVNEASRGKVLVFISELSHGNSLKRPQLFSGRPQIIWLLPIAFKNSNQIPAESNFTHNFPKTKHTKKKQVYTLITVGQEVSWDCTVQTDHERSLSLLDYLADIGKWCEQINKIYICIFFGSSLNLKVKYCGLFPPVFISWELNQTETLSHPCQMWIELNLTHNEDCNSFFFLPFL